MKHLAQLNISRLRFPLDAPEMHEFVHFLDSVNQFGTESDGFVWLFKADDGSASSFMPPLFDDEKIIVNMTVWENIESLYHFAFSTVHRYFMQKRHQWFEKATQPQTVLWWIEAGHIPTIEEAKTKLTQLRKHGATPEAFSFQQMFDEDGTAFALSTK